MDSDSGRLLHTLSRHFDASDKLLFTTLSRQLPKAPNRLEIAQLGHTPITSILPIDLHFRLVDR